jgi:hypothetical protein
MFSTSIHITTQSSGARKLQDTPDPHASNPINIPISPDNQRAPEHQVTLGDSREQRDHQHSSEYAKDRETGKGAERGEKQAEGLVELSDLVQAEEEVDEVDDDMDDEEHCCWWMRGSVGRVDTEFRSRGELMMALLAEGL